MKTFKITVNGIVQPSNIEAQFEAIALAVAKRLYGKENKVTIQEVI